MKISLETAARHMGLSSGVMLDWAQGNMKIAEGKIPCHVKPPRAICRNSRTGGYFFYLEDVLRAKRDSAAMSNKVLATIPSLG